MSATEVFALADDFAKAAMDMDSVLRPVVQEGMSEIKDQWRANATATSGVHGRHYPNSITYETRVLAGEVVGEVGPDSSKKQGSMGRGFEFGSRNQPPHLDGLKAASAVGPLLDRRLSTAVGFLLP